MSLDIYLTSNGEEVFTRNITHNLGKMAGCAEIYKHLWRPEELEITCAFELIIPLRKALHEMVDYPNKFVACEPENGWGDFAEFFAFVWDYYLACKEHPAALITASR